MADDENRRSDSRRNLNLQVEYPDKQGYSIDFTESVSAGGLLIRSSQHHRVGDTLRVAVSLPGFPESVDIVGVVTRIREATATEPRGIGLQISREAYVEQLGKVLSPADSSEFGLVSGPYSLLAALPQVRLARTPTPLHRAERLSKMLDGPEIWLKRDDLTGFALGGNEVRKLEMVAADALQSGADTLVATVQNCKSSRLRVMSAVAARLGLKAVAVVSEGLADGCQVSTLLGTELRPYPVPAASIAANLDACMQELASEGRKPYAISEGVQWLSACGYVLASIELVSQLRRQHLRPDVLVCPVGSAETMSGLVVAQRWLDCSYDVLGLSVARSEQWCAERVTNIASEVCSHLRLLDTIPVADIWLNADYAGDGFGTSPPAAIDAVTKVARLEGIFLDPQFTGKSMAGLMNLIAKGELRKGQTVVFLHTGGTL